MPPLSAFMNPFTGYVCLALGVFHLVYPSFFRRGIWLRTDIAQRLLSPANYTRYMRAWGVFMLLSGCFVLGKYYLAGP